MIETDFAFFHLDHSPGDAPFPPGPVNLKGWAVAKPGFFLTDLRVRCRGQISPATFGHPRPDLAAYFKSREPFLLAGFDVNLTLAPGENLAAFEACEIAGEWRPLATTPLVADPGPPTTEAAPGVVAPHEFVRALRLLLQAGEPRPRADVAAEIAGWLPVPHVTRFPALPFHGHLHHPPRLQRAEFGRVIVEGWLFHETQKIRRVAASVDLQAWSLLEQEGSVPYVAGLFPQFPHAAACRIHGSMDVPAQLPQPLSIRVYAELEDHSWHLCQVERAHLYGDEPHKAPFAPYRLRTFLGGVRTLRQACLARGFTVPVDAGFYRAVREVWREYRARAPRHPAGTLASPPVVTPARETVPACVVLITHNLNLEGAPLFLLEYAVHLSTRGTKIFVISAGDGPLRASFQLLGATVDLVDIAPLLEARSAGELRGALRTLAREANLNGADLVVANTLSTYWGVLLAQRAGKRSLFYIHESTTPDSFYFGYMVPATLPVVKSAFTAATHVSFLTASTRRYYEPHLRRANHSLNPGWIDLHALAQFRAQHSREELREDLALDPATRLVINVGTVCNRKGQHIFVRAVDLLWRRRPELARQAEFVMVGGRDTPYDAAIADLVAHLNRPNLRVAGETPTPLRYYGAADVFVCSSYEESFPRVVLEAMAFGLPIASTNVHGIPEMVRDGEEAVLVPPGDSSALADAMARLLAEPTFAQKLGARAQVRVAAEFDSATLLPRHAALSARVTREKL